MLTNDQMKAGRFAQWAKVRKRLAIINQAFDENGNLHKETTRQVF